MAAKAVLASLALGFLNWVGVSFWPVVIFLGVMFAIYLSEPPERRALRSSFWLLSIFSILGIAAVSFLSGYFLIGLMTAFLILFFGLSLFFIFCSTGFGKMPPKMFDIYSMFATSYFSLQLCP